MSLNINIYTNYLSDSLIPNIIKRLNDYEMFVEVHPDFSFNNQTGFLPFKFKLTKPHLDILNDKVLKSGFELDVDNFDFKTEIKNLKPTQSVFAKLIGKTKSEAPLLSSDIESRLKDCNKVVTFVWGSADSFELRFAWLTSSILTELTNGVCFYQADNIWYGKENIVDKAFQEIINYENTLTEKDIVFHEFTEW